jgi:hypothetical protein
MVSVVRREPLGKPQSEAARFTKSGSVQLLGVGAARDMALTFPAASL